ncbi:N-acetylmuramoyl-L-alanine amidase [Thioclava atlantica]|uniref:N-acetylmuramoyl-L-alanine amidase n=1 Tax=Thioclava atlantica TaxID=1317124 RepID=A0A085TWE3_9RHOB|nr:N-acetylmuramoyl-L-alanine amidase [Thioclava atlantica]KFE35040.1 N-acetylmuramoyl-L-alanine amidase [Thioclava atlantica]
MIRRFITLIALLCAVATTVRAQELSALARYEPTRSAIAREGGATRISLGISQPVPFRAYLLADPYRLVIDFREVNFGSNPPAALIRKGGAIKDLRWGRFRPGWSRMVAELSGPMELASAEERTGASPEIRLLLKPVPAAQFRPREGAADSALWDLPQPAAVDRPHRRQDGTRPLRIVLDPGHGGIDPGAEDGGVHEADIVLGFARQLRDALRRAGMSVVMTRDQDVFVPLETRVTVARAAAADLFVSLHADSIAEGRATGATVYRLADHAENEATRKLVQRHDRDDLLAGVDLNGQGDQVAHVLVDLARRETQPRSVRLAQVLAGAIKGEGLHMHKHPVQGANFSVLKSPDIPSVLVELGFLSSPADRKRLADPDWRARMAEAITRGIERWAQSDAAEGRLLRQ